MPTVAFFSPAWPASIAASGIVSYVDGMARGIQSRGWKSVVLAGRIGETDVSCGIAAYSVRRSSRLEQVALKCLYQPRTFADNLGISFKQLNTKHQLDIIEMEESFGWAANVARALPIPVIVRLHGPWFLTGITEVSTGDPAFIDRVARERQSLKTVKALFQAKGKPGEHFDELISWKNGELTHRAKVVSAKGCWKARPGMDVSGLSR